MKKKSRWKPQIQAARPPGRLKCKGGQIYGDRRFNFGWSTHDAMYVYNIIEMDTRNLRDPINQCHPDKFNWKIILKIEKKRKTYIGRGEL